MGGGIHLQTTISEDSYNPYRKKHQTEDDEDDDDGGGVEMKRTIFIACSLPNLDILNNTLSKERLSILK